MLSSARKVPSIIFSLLLWRRIQAQCYYPDHTSAPNDIVCNSSAPFSPCCQNGAICLTTGLCFLETDTSINTGTCTDKTWASLSCFQTCTPSLWNDHGFHTLYRCSDNLWCCSMGGNTTSCCSDGGVELFPLPSGGVVTGGTGFLTGSTIATVETLQTSMSTEPSSTSATSNAIDTGPTKSYSSAAAGNTTDTPTPYPEHNVSVRDATKTSLSAGLGVGLPLLAGLTLALVYLRHLRSQSKSQSTGSEEKSAGVVVDGELPTHYERPEMESLPAEMPNSRREITQELGVPA